MISPSLVLAVVIGLFDACAYVFIRGRAGARLPFLLVASILGAWAGDAIGGRMGLGIGQVGDFHLVAAAIVSWVGMGLVVLLAVLAPARADQHTATKTAKTIAPATPASTAASTSSEAHG